MGGVDGTSRNFKRLALVTDARQIITARVELPQVVEARHVFTNNPSGPSDFDNAEHCRPEVTVIVKASLVPGCAPRLAGKSAGEYGDTSKPGKVGSDPDVSNVGDSGPAFLEDTAGVGLDFAEAGGSETGPAGREGESSNAGKKVKVGEFMGHLISGISSSGQCQT